jgi:hypothetical protein
MGIAKKEYNETKIGVEEVEAGIQHLMKMVLDFLNGFRDNNMITMSIF